MAATIGNFSSGDVLTAAQMDTLGLEFLDDQTFTGYGGVSSDVLSSDFTHYMVQWFGTNANISAVSLQFRRSGSQITTNNYNYGTNGVTFSTSAAFTNAAQNTNIFRLGSVSTGGSFMSMFLTLGYDNVAMATWQLNVQNLETWQGSGHFDDGSAVTGWRIARSSGLTTMRMRVYGLRN